MPGRLSFKRRSRYSVLSTSAASRSCARPRTRSVASWARRWRPSSPATASYRRTSSTSRWPRTTRTSSSWTKAHSGVIAAHRALAFSANRAHVSATAWADLRCAPRDLASSPCRAGLVLAGAAGRRTFGGGRACARRWAQTPRRNLGPDAWPCRSRPRPRPGGGSSSGPRRGQSRSARAPVRYFRCRFCACRAQDRPTRLRSRRPLESSALRWPSHRTPDR
jgi:hypothetical protein